MTKAKKILITIDGITGPADSEDYFGKALESSQFDLTVYDKRVYIPTERIFDKPTVNWLFLATLPFKLIPGVNDLIDKTDFFTYYFNKGKRKKACLLVRATIKGFKSLGYEVHVATHSFGGVILLSSQSLCDKAYITACPLGLKPKFGSNWVKKHLAKFIPYFVCPEIHYFYSKEDFVSCKSFIDDPQIKDLMYKAQTDKVGCHGPIAPHGHDAEFYADDMGYHLNYHDRSSNKNKNSGS
jgi:hypothetical protein